MTGSAPGGLFRATVIIPTFGDAPFVRCAIESAQAQTVKDLEICVILDGSPPSIRELLEGLAAKDERIRIFAFPKAPRTGETHRAKVIPQTSGRIICYLSHDDLWFPHHVETLERSLVEADFVHSVHINAGLGETFGTVQDVLLCDLSDPEYQRRMMDHDHPANFFGLTCGAHTRAAYDRLDEGWNTAPDSVWTDLNMWRKFLGQDGIRAESVLAFTALHFPAPMWNAHFSSEAFAHELDAYLSHLGDPAFQVSMLNLALREVAKQCLGQEICIRDVKREITQREVRLASMVEAETQRCIRTLPLRKIWKLAWKRLTRQYRPNP